MAGGLGAAFIGGTALGRQFALDRANAQAQQQQFELAQVAAQRQAMMAQAQLEHMAAQNKRLGEQTDVARQTLEFQQGKAREEQAQKANAERHDQFMSSQAPQTKSRTAIEHFGDQVAGITAMWPKYNAAPETPQGVPSLLSPGSAGEGAQPLASPWQSLASEQDAKAQRTQADNSVWANSKPAVAAEVAGMNAKLGADVRGYNAAKDAESKKGDLAEARRQKTAGFQRITTLKKDLMPVSGSLPAAEAVDSMMARYTGDIPGVTGVTAVNRTLAQLSPEEQQNRSTLQQFVGNVRHELYGANLTAIELKAWNEAQSQGWVTDPAAFRSAMKKLREAQDSTIGAALAGTDPEALVTYVNQLPAKHPLRRHPYVAEVYRSAGGAGNADAGVWAGVNEKPGAGGKPGGGFSPGAKSRKVGQ
jgi:hypothetical protein